MPALATCRAAVQEGTGLRQPEQQVTFAVGRGLRLLRYLGTPGRAGAGAADEPGDGSCLIADGEHDTVAEGRA
jgi:hypothetical protein